MKETIFPGKTTLNSAGLFVTGTDTEVGKTFVAASLVKALKASYWKPIQTGPFKDHDSPEIQRLTGIDETSIYSCSYSFPDPLSPHAAAKNVDKVIDLENIRLPEHGAEEFLVVEGAGGVLVPLNDDFMMIDLIVRLGFPVVIVARSGLGTINHTLLTLESLRSREINVAGVIMNGPANPGNRNAIEKYGDIEVLAELPQCDDVSFNTIASLKPKLQRVTELFGRNVNND
ncbi:dethiobiotin synthase [Kiloniella antarctica]|uniref:ATP-dependent dethiobiotin synthetase BioD n=1 Tax=Kiloniella antarctica TaxID=1550907 RepID=A0ABW5BQF1_9PROT